MVNIKRIKIVAGMAFMITLYSSRAFAFGIPLLCGDMGNLVASAKVIMSEVMIIKQEVESNLRIIEEIRNGGFAAAGAMIFEKIQNGDYDRFGQSLTNIKNEGKNATENVKARKEMKEREKALIASGMSEKEAKLKAQQEVSAKLEEEKRKRMLAAEGAKMSRGKNAGQKAYDWLKNNKSFTSGASSALRGVESGNIGQIVSGAAGATGGAVGDNAVGNVFTNTANSAGNVVNSAINGDVGGIVGNAAAGAGAGIGDNKVGNIFTNTANSAGQAVNSAINGDIGGAIGHAGQGVGAGVGTGTGSQGLGNMISGVSNVTGGAYNGISNADNFGEAVTGVANSEQINYGLDNIGGGAQQMQDSERAALEAQKKAAEETRAKNQQVFDEYQRQLKEKEEAEKKAAEEQRQRGLEEQKEAAKKECSACRAAKGDSSFECSFQCSMAGM